MSVSPMRTAIVRVLGIMIAAGIGFALASSPSYAQQQERLQLFVTPPENARTVWFLQARHVASELELNRQDRGKLTRAYISARQQHLDKVKELPKTRESFRQFREIGREARSSLEESLVEALGQEKGKKAAEALGGFNFLADHMTADILAVQNKALGSLLEYQKGVNKVMTEARESGSFEGAREKFRALLLGLAQKISAIYSEQQLSEWQEKYGWLFEMLGSQ